MGMVIDKHIPLMRTVLLFIVMFLVSSCYRDLGEVLECIYLADDNISHSEFLDIANVVGSSMSMEVIDHDIPPDPREPNKPSIEITLWGSQVNASISNTYRPSICVREESSPEEAVAVLDAFKNQLNKRNINYRVETREEREKKRRNNPKPITRAK
jgi:hypothetical protein